MKEENPFNPFLIVQVRGLSLPHFKTLQYVAVSCFTK
jgi:hypothetical protein